MNAILIVAVVIQIIVATQSEGVMRSLCELTAFLLVIVLVFRQRLSPRRRKQDNKVMIEPEDL
ncbi:hypothetical protein H4F17_11245 [Vibrio cholerae]